MPFCIILQQLPMFGKSMSMMDTHTQTVADQLVSLQQQLKHWMASQTSKLFATDGDVTVKSNLTGLDEGIFMFFLVHNNKS